jgi:hypothetical protein
MLSQILHRLDYVTELLQYFASSAVTFAASDDSLAATNIGTGAAFEVGDHIVVSGSSESANNTTHTVTISAVNKITCGASAITDDNAGEAIVINQEYQGTWQKVERWAKLTGSINCSGNCYVYIDQSGDGVSTDYTTTVTVTGGTAASWAVESVLPYTRIRIRNNGADQTSMRAYSFARHLT